VLYERYVPGDNPQHALPVSAPASCRLCGHDLRITFVDLGMSPLCERFLRAEQLNEMEPFYPLHVWICENCLLVQLESYVGREEIFTDDYAYFSSFSTSWLEHARAYAQRMTTELGLGPGSRVVELASNDGYLLRHFVDLGIGVLGIDPAANVAEAARAVGVETIVEFFGAETAERVVAERGHADLIVANNVLAHVPDLNDFIAGIRVLLAPGGTATLEMPHVVRLIEGLQYDTIYHEHFSYFSLHALVRAFAQNDLELFDVEELRSHGGSLRIFVRHPGGEGPAGSVQDLLDREASSGYDTVEGYLGFGTAVADAKASLLELLIAARRDGKSVAGYGAPGKGNTLLNYCGIRTDLIEYTVDRNPGKHGMFLPGTHIPVYPPERLAETQPDVIVILPWNLQREIAEQLQYTQDWGAQLVVPIPDAQVIS
jgi:SAM-dependent methyltransferase